MASTAKPLLRRVRDAVQLLRGKEVAPAAPLEERSRSRRPARFVPGTMSAMHAWSLREFAAARQEDYLNGFRSTSASIDGDLFSSLRTLRRRSRTEAHNDPYVKRFLSMVRTHVVGPDGIRLQADFVEGSEKDERDSDYVEARWKEWCKASNCDAAGQMSFLEAQQLIAETVARDGECLVRILRNFDNPWKFAIQVLETDVLDEQHFANLPNGNRIILGVEQNPWGRPVAYHFRGTRAYTDPISHFHRRQTERVPAEDLLHIYVHHRGQQSRGYPWTHATLRRLHHLNGYDEAEVYAARFGACKQGWIENDGNAPPAMDDTVVDESGEQAGPTVMEMEPGTIRELLPGQKFQSFDPQHPNSAYDSFIRAQVRGIASGLDVSYNVLASDLEKVSYSSIRTAVLEERDQWRTLQNWLSSRLHDQLYPAWLDMGMLTGQLRLPAHKREKFLRVKWQPRGWSWVDPLKDIQAAREALSLGLTTRKEILASQGRDLSDTLKQLAEEDAAAENLGISIGAVSKPVVEVDEDGEVQEKPAAAPAASEKIQPSKDGGNAAAAAGATLTGVQIEAAQNVIANLIAGQIPSTVAVELLVALGFPSEKAQAMVEAAETFEPDPVPDEDADGAAPQDDAADERAAPRRRKGRRPPSRPSPFRFQERPPQGA